MMATPMGWSLPTFLAQESHSEGIRRVSSLWGLVEIPHKCPAPELRPGKSCFLPYADNGNFLALDSPELVNDDKNTCSAHLNKSGCETHEETDASTLSSLPGVMLDGEVGLVTGGLNNVLSI